MEQYTDSNKELSPDSGIDDLIDTVLQSSSVRDSGRSQPNLNTSPRAHSGHPPFFNFHHSIGSLDSDSLQATHANDHIPQVQDFRFRNTPAVEHLKEEDLISKELLKRERNRAAAQRSNMKKRLQKENQKRELQSLREKEKVLRAIELKMREENTRLRKLVYMSGQRLPVIQPEHKSQIVHIVYKP